MPSNIPTMRTLLDDPAYRAYVKRVPPVMDSHNPADPWQLWVETPEHKWLTKTYPTYRDAWTVGVARFREGSDFTITARRMFYAPPGEWYPVKVRLATPRVSSASGKVTTHRVELRWRQTWFWDATDLNWCGRCRRPVYWQPLHSTHHALRRLPALSTEDNWRCTICGIRYIAQPAMSQMTKLEVKP